MKTWICTTLTSFFAPTQGAARLYAYLRKHGHDASLNDFNQNAYFTLLSKEYLEQTYDKLTFMIGSLRWNRFLREDVGSIILNSSVKGVKNLLLNGVIKGTRIEPFLNSPSFIKSPIFSILGSRIKEDNVVYAMILEKDHVISEIEKARDILDKEFLNLPAEEFITHYRTLLCGKALIDAVYFPTQLDLGLGFTGIEYTPSARDIYRAVSDENHNYLIPYYRNEVLPRIRKESPEIVGISISHGSEYIPALTLASTIKSESPETHICLGGAVVTETSHRVCNNPSLWEFFDSIVLGPGEKAFSELLEQIQTKRDLNQVPNLLYKENGSIKRSNKHHEFDLNEACTPEYVSLRSKPILPLETSSGCYWGKCIFCYYPKEGTADHSTEYNKNRVRNIELVLNDINTLKERHDPIYIGITDSSLHPKRLEDIAEYNLSGKKGINFSAFVRFEKEFKSLSFCRKLAEGGFLGGQVGLESGSQKVNDIINKGVDLDDAREILKNFSTAGILMHLYSIVGLPGELKEDSKMTEDFIKQQHRMLTMGWQIYPMGVTEHGPLAFRADEFGLQLTPMPDDYLAQVMQYENKNGLSQAESIAMSVSIYEKLKKHLHPLNNIMDVESHKLFLLAQKSRGNNPDKIRHV
jgi:anaerobic magnesium-protoporphyrin IX monomethyl ester cyclase